MSAQTYADGEANVKRRCIAIGGPLHGKVVDVQGSTLAVPLFPKQPRLWWWPQKPLPPLEFQVFFYRVIRIEIRGTRTWSLIPDRVPLEEERDWIENFAASAIAGHPLCMGED